MAELRQIQGMQIPRHDAQRWILGPGAPDWLRRIWQESSSTQQVHVQVLDDLSALFTGVNEQPVAGIINPLVAGDLLCSFYNLY